MYACLIILGMPSITTMQNSQLLVTTLQLAPKRDLLGSCTAPISTHWLHSDQVNPQLIPKRGTSLPPPSRPPPQAETCRMLTHFNSDNLHIVSAGLKRLTWCFKLSNLPSFLQSPLFDGAGYQLTFWCDTTPFNPKFVRVYLAKGSTFQYYLLWYL